MITQLETLKWMMVRNQVWQKEVSDSLGHPASETEMLATVHLYASLGAHHAYPRLTINARSWTYDDWEGSCRDTCQMEMLVEVTRSLPAENATALDAQYLDVATMIRDMTIHLSEMSYGQHNPDNRNYLGAVQCEVGELILEDVAEELVTDPEDGAQLACWWCNIVVTPRAT